MLTIKKIINSQIWVASLLSILIIGIGLPIFIGLKQTPEVVAAGINVKNGDRIFYNFLEVVKKKNDILVLGTSETGAHLNGNNYWSLLNKDKDLNRDFHTFGGAGRCAYTYFPLILDNSEAFKGVEIIYYINPTYWREGLNAFNVAYYQRYVNAELARAVKSDAEANGIYEEFVEQGVEGSSPIPFYLDRWVENYRSLFYSDLDLIISGKTKMGKKTKSIQLTYKDTAALLKKTDELNDLELNATDEFAALNFPFPKINTKSDFQYNMLGAFVELVDQYDINCKFYLGPYNELYCKALNPEFLTDHQATVVKIKAMLIEAEVDFIDGSYQGAISGTFNDIQHISEYGTYLTALDIKKYYEKED